MLHQRKQEIIAKVQQCIERGNQLYGITLPHLAIHFDLKGRAAGMACKRGHQYYLRFNTDMMTREAWDHIINDTVPHEVAHSFCQFQPRLGRNHDAGWARVCRDLGGNGERCHSEEVVYGKGYTYEYITDRGHKVRMGDKHHQMVQRGVPLMYKKGKGTVKQNCQYSVVGYGGKTLANPRVFNPTTTVAPPPVSTAPVVRPVAPAPRTVAPTPFAGNASKASISRSIMLAGHGRGQTYEQIIAAMMAACGYDRQLARATYKANFHKVGCPAP
jgi:predicted SprT family Zn-dependent metalloprotease